MDDFDREAVWTVQMMELVCERDSLLPLASRTSRAKELELSVLVEIPPS